jgi:hypothetical protein
VAIHRIADRLEPQLRADLLKALDQLARQIPLGRLAEMIDAGNIGGIQEAIAGIQLPPAVQDTVRQTLQRAAGEVGQITSGGFGLDFGLDNPRAVEWARRHTGEMIRQVTSETVQAVRNIVEAGIRDGVPPLAQAKLIRGHVGLTQRMGRTLELYEGGLRESGFAQKRIDELVRRRRAKLLRRRAENIARTETIRAANQGQLMAWRDAKDAGLIDTARVARVWIATDDDRTCPLCNELDNKTVGFEGAFDIAAASDVSGRAAFADHDGMTPPAHVACRCAVGLEEVDQSGGAERMFDGAEDPEELHRRLTELEATHPELRDQLRGISIEAENGTVPGAPTAADVLWQSGSRPGRGGTTFSIGTADGKKSWIVMSRFFTKGNVGGRGQLAILNHEVMHARVAATLSDPTRKRRSLSAIWERAMETVADPKATGSATRMSSPAGGQAHRRLTRLFGPYATSDTGEFIAEVFATASETDKHWDTISTLQARKAARVGADKAGWFPTRAEFDTLMGAIRDQATKEGIGW